MLAAWAGPRAEAQAVPCDQALVQAEEHYRASDFEAAEDLVLACMDGAAKADVLRGHRLLALAFIRQGRMTEAQLAVLRILAVDYGYQPDVEIDPPFYVALVSTVREQLRVEPGQGGVPPARTEQVATRPPPARPAPTRTTPAPPRSDSPSAAPPVRDGADDDPVVDRGPIDVNTASAADLQSISGIGPALADRIVAYRTRYGAFRRPEDLENVRGSAPSRSCGSPPRSGSGTAWWRGRPPPSPSPPSPSPRSPSPRSRRPALASTSTRQRPRSSRRSRRSARPSRAGSSRTARPGVGSGASTSSSRSVGSARACSNGSPPRGRRVAGANSSPTAR